MEKIAHLLPEHRFFKCPLLESPEPGANILLLMYADKPLRVVQPEGSGICARPRLLELRHLFLGDTAHYLGSIIPGHESIGMKAPLGKMQGIFSLESIAEY